MWNKRLTLNIVRALTLLTFSIMLSGCGKKEIKGQIFIVTQAKENIKLALVTVGAIPQEEFDSHLKAKRNKKLEQQKLLLTKYEEAKSEIEKSNAMYGWYEYLMKPPSSSAIVKSSKKELARLDEVIAKDKAAIAEYESFDKTEFLFEGLPLPKTINKTDVDGKFTLTLPKGKYVITANSSRSAFGSLESYYWLVSVDTSSVNQLLMLSNDNLLETKCNECVKLQ